MYSKDELRKLKTEFWESFAAYCEVQPYLRRRRKMWVLYNTKVKGVELLGHDHADDARALGDQPPGEGVGVIAQLPGGGVDPGLGIRVHIGCIVQRAGDSAHRHTGSFCHILNGH